MENEKCKDVIQRHFSSRINDLRTLWNAEENETEELGSLFEYGLCIDKVEAGTFKGQREDYIRYQLSWGGGQDEFRLYKNGDLEFWYLDWFDGAKIDVEGKDGEIIKNIIELSGVSF